MRRSSSIDSALKVGLLAGHNVKFDIEKVQSVLIDNEESNLKIPFSLHVNINKDLNVNQQKKNSTYLEIWIDLYALTSQQQKATFKLESSLVKSVQ